MIGLLASAGNPILDPLVTCSGLPLASVNVEPLGLPRYECPYHLPRIDSGEAVVVTSAWLRDIDEHGFDLGEALVVLRSRFDRLVGLDLADPFQLVFSDEMLSLMDEVLKINGLYSDRDLYGYVVGASTADGRWTEKSRPRSSSYSAQNLRKIRLSIPAFIAVNPQVRAKGRPLYGRSRMYRLGLNSGDWLLNQLPRPMKSGTPPPYTVHFFAALTHIQRASAAGMLRNSSLRWKGGITGVPPTIAGLDEMNTWKRPTPSERGAICTQLLADNLLAPALSRAKYLLGMRKCKAVLSITGYGEICYRMAEAWANRRVLVCQDLSHVATLFPLKRGYNVVYCKPDLSDLIAILEDIECNFDRYLDIAEQGYKDWMKWSEDPYEIVRAGFAPLYSFAVSPKE